MKNIIDFQLENRLTKNIKDLRKLLSEYRTKQNMGVDNVLNIITSLLSLTFGELPPGDVLVIQATVSPNDQKLTIWNLLWTFNGNIVPDTEPDRHWPDGIDDNAEKVGAVISINKVLDWANSVDATGVRKAYFILRNSSLFTYQGEFLTRWYGIKQTTGAVLE